MNNSNLIILTFVVTALWDVALRYMALNFNKVPSIIQNLMPFIGDLEPYFKIHTLLAAALIAGFVGATTQPIILAITPFPKNIMNLSYVLKFLVVSFSSDWRFPVARSKEITDALIQADKDVSHIIVETDKGHDSFLLPIDRYTKAMSAFLNQAYISKIKEFRAV